MYFSNLQIGGWQQFGKIEIDFHERVTILTGANASGKTTLLGILAQHSTWQTEALATPEATEKNESKRGGLYQFVVNVLGGLWASKIPDDQQAIGMLRYDREEESPIVVPTSPAAKYNVGLLHMKRTPCFYIPSHRPVYNYIPLKNISTSRIDAMAAFQRVHDATKNRYFGTSDQPPSFHMKAVLISWSIFGRGNKDMPGDRELLSQFQGYQDVLHAIFPETLGFRRLSIRNMEVVMECTTGEFMIDAVSGGISALMDVAWQIFMFEQNQEENYTVIMDEPENHLHPSLQRELLPNLLKAFPNARFVVGTHSPLIVSSVRRSNVYVLRYGPDGRVFSSALNFAKSPKDAEMILSEVLDVGFTYPMWAEEALNRIADRFNSGKVTESSVRELEKDLENEGLNYFLPKIIEDRRR